MIWIVDDDSTIRDIEVYTLNSTGFEAKGFASGVPMFEALKSERPELIVLDIMMPVMDGVETCRALREDPALKHTHVVFLSALGEEDDQLSGFDAGADDYLSKPIPMKLLVSRVQAILKRINTEQQPAQNECDIQLDPHRHTILCRGEEIPLPRKEFSLMELLMTRSGELVTREEIYSKIWGHEVIVGDRTIDVHIRKLRQKIGEEHIQTIKGVGYMFVK